MESVLQNARHYHTDPGGRFEIWLPPGEYTLETHYGEAVEKVEWKGLVAGQTNLVLDIPGFNWSEAEVGKVFDEFWEVMDRRYSYFFLKKEVDWRESKSRYRAKAVQAQNPKELATVLTEMLTPLRDIHVWINTPEGRVSTHRGSYTYNGNRSVTLDGLSEKIKCDEFAVVGKTKADGFGCFVMLNQGAATSNSVREAIVAIEKLHDTPGFVVDLRRANGGSEPLAQEIAALFCAKDTVYAKSKYRNGPGHKDFGQEDERILRASPRPYLKPVVCLIGPGAVSSGEGFVKMMAALPQVTTVGLATRGASGNPRPWPLGRTGLTLYFSRWVDLMPNGQSFEGIGIPPAVEVNEPVSAYAQRDPTLEKGLELLRAKVKAH